METFLGSYRDRMERNSNQLLALADELTKRGYIVRYYKSKPTVSGITIYHKDNGTGVRLQFNEVPYRWTLEYDIKPSRESGSGYSGKEGWNNNEIPFTVEELIENFKPMYVDKRFADFKQTHTIEA